MSEVTTLETPAASAVESQAPVTPDAALAESQSPPAEEPVFASGAEYAETLGKSQADATKAPDSTQPARRGPLTDPRAAEYLTAFRSATQGRQTRLESEQKTALAAMGIEGDAANLIINVAKGILNEEHSDALQRGHYEAGANTLQDINDSIRASMKVGLTAAAGRKLDESIEELIKTTGNASYESAFEIREALKYDGWLSPKDVAAKVATAFDKGLAQGRNVAGTVDDSNRANGRVSGGGTSNGQWKTKVEARRLFNADKLSRDEMKRINADPNIPEGL